MDSAYAFSPVLPRRRQRRRRSNHAKVHYASVALRASLDHVICLHAACTSYMTARQSSTMLLCSDSASLADRFVLCSAHPDRHQRERDAKINQTARDPHDQPTELLVLERRKIPC